MDDFSLRAREKKTQSSHPHLLHLNIPVMETVWTERGSSLFFLVARLGSLAYNRQTRAASPNPLGPHVAVAVFFGFVTKPSLSFCPKVNLVCVSFATRNRLWCNFQILRDLNVVCRLLKKKKTRRGRLHCNRRQTRVERSSHIDVVTINFGLTLVSTNANSSYFHY